MKKHITLITGKGGYRQFLKFLWFARIEHFWLFITQGRYWDGEYYRFKHRRWGKRDPENDPIAMVKRRGKFLKWEITTRSIDIEGASQHFLKTGNVLLRRFEASPDAPPEILAEIERQNQESILRDKLIRESDDNQKE